MKEIGNLKVLVIDDETYVANTLVWILEAAGIEATAEYDGPSALKRIESFAADVVICDVIMPGMNGVETCEMILEKYPCHILLWSGQAATNELVHDARKRGLSWEFLAKPIEPEELLTRLASLGHNGAPEAHEIASRGSRK